MRKAISYGLMLIGTLLIGSLNSWGCVSLPQLSSRNYLWAGLRAAVDTVPVKTMKTPPEEQPAQAAAKAVVQPVVKQVPKSSKKLKPAALAPKVNITPAKIIKPKTIIKKINLNVH